MRGADLLAQTLSARGVTRIYSLSGNQIMPIYDACIDAGICLVHTRHEAAAVFMADGWAQLTGQPGVALVTAAPGFANAMGPLFSARASESPVLLLSGDSPQSMDGMGAFQELDQVAVSRPLCKHSFRSSAADTIGDDIDLALQTALSGRPGPVHLALPFDVLEAATDKTVSASPVSAIQAPAAADGVDDASMIAGQLAAAVRPLVLTGPALNRTRAGQWLDQIRASHQLPVLAMESPRGLNDPSLGALAQVIQRADLILCLGKSVDFTLANGRPGPIAQATQWLVVDAEQGARQRAADNLGDRLRQLVAADPARLAAQLAQSAGAGSQRAEWLAEVDRLTGERAHTQVPELINGRLSPAALCAAVQRQMDRQQQPVLVCDGGEFGQWAQACLRGHERIINGPSGAIGGSVCYAIAACHARPEARVFAMMGDGTSGFHLAEFETAVRDNAPLVAIIGNDSCWNAEHQIQLREYGAERLIGCMLSEARYDLAVAALGGHGEYVTEPAALDAALQRAIDSGLPACVNVRIEGLPAPSAT